MIRLRLLSCVWLLCAAPCLWGAALPPQFDARYAVSSNGSAMGVMSRRFSTGADGHFSFRSELKATRGLLALLRVKVLEESIWQLRGEAEFRPLEYLYRQTGGRTREVSVSFDWGSGIIRNRAKGRDWEMDIVPGVLDKLLYQLVLMRDLLAGKEEFDYVVADGGKIKTYHIVKVGEETVETPLGALQAVKLVHRKSGSPRMTTLWCARALQFLPIRLDHIEKDGQQTTAVIQSVSGIGAPAATAVGHAAP